MDLAFMRLDDRDGIASIRFDRDGKPNVMDAAFLDSLERVLDYAENSSAVRVVVLSGNDRSFIVGADINRLAQADPSAALRVTDQTMRVQERLADLSKPTIAALTGLTLGGGLEVALCCDFRVAASHARLGLPEIGLGIIPGGGGTQRLPRVVGLARATEFVLLGEAVDAKTALAMNLVHRTCEKDELESVVGSLAQKLAAKPTAALRAAKAALRASQSADLKSGLLAEQHLFSLLFGTDDQKEGMSAFLQKREPRFEGLQEVDSGN